MFFAFPPLMFGLSELDIRGRVRDASQGWYHQTIQKPDENNAATRTGWHWKVPRAPSSRTISRLALTITFLLILTSLAQLRAHRRIIEVGVRLLAPDHAAQDSSDVSWNRFAYCQYVTNPDYLCNSLMVFEALHRLGSKADRLMMYPNYWNIDSDNLSTEAKLLLQARDAYDVHLAPVEVLHEAGDDTWADSFTKLLAFNQTQYARVISLDSDANVLKVGLQQRPCLLQC